MEAHPLLVLIVITDAAEAKVAAATAFLLCYLFIDPIKNGR
jgi:hypothetical protein